MKFMKEPLASFINFISNDHEGKILFIIGHFGMEFRIKMNTISIRKPIVEMDVVNDVTCMPQSVITLVVI